MCQMLLLCFDVLCDLSSPLCKVMVLDHQVSTSNLINSSILPCLSANITLMVLAYLEILESRWLVQATDECVHLEIIIEKVHRRLCWLERGMDGPPRGHWTSVSS